MEQALSRATQEALSNTSCYSGANNFIVKLYSIGLEIFIVIQDDGSGFDLTSVTEKGMGLISKFTLLIVRRLRCMPGERGLYAVTLNCSFALLEYFQEKFICHP